MLWLYYTIKTWLSKHWPILTVVLLAMAFFVATSSYNYLTQSPDFVKWTSPDESANYFLSKRYAQTGELTFENKNNLYALGMITPRSFRTDGSLIKPVSFLGLPLIYGTIAKIFSPAVLPYLTPFFATIGLIFFYLIVKRLFKLETALIATFILSAFPVYIYFSAHSMFHNMLFIVLWLVGIYFSIRLTETSVHLPAGANSKEKRQHYLNWFFACLAGYFTGLAVTVRSSEMIWLLPVLLLIWLFNFYRLGLVKLFLFVYFFCLAFLPIMTWNTILYKAPTSTGYPKMDESIASLSSGSTQLVQATISADKTRVQESFDVLEKAFFFFGLNPGHSYKMLDNYIFKMFSWLVLTAIIGFIFFVFKFKTKRKNDLLYILCLGVLSVILIFYYGSWIFYDNPDPNSFTIGNSYTRYWLPIYLGIIPFAAIAIVRLSSWFKWRPLVWAIRAIVVAILMLNSIWFVLYGSAEGLVFGMAKQINSKAEMQQVLAQTPADAVIITRYHDKLLFPERQIIVGLLTDQNMNRGYASLAAKAPVYYYNFSFSDRDIKHLNKNVLGLVGLKIEKINQITKDFTLYKLELTE